MDIISQFSDDLLLRILSLVPTKDVVATSLLSKRWRSLWNSVSKLAYDDSVVHTGDYKNFSQFVYRSLLSNKAPVLDKLYLKLKLGADCPFIDIGLWINIALSRCLRALEIDVLSKEVSLNLPINLYTSETLEILTLINCIVLDVPLSVRLPSLKTLSLELVDYIDNETLPRLLSGCPKLEVLYVRRHVGDATTDSIVAPAPSLQRLTLLDVHTGTCGRFVVDAPSLKYLKITDSVAYDLRQMEHMPALVEAYLCINSGVTQKFLKALTSVHRLSLSLSLSEVMHPSGMIFNQLVHLDLYTCTEGWWGLLTCMLQDSPKLQFLKLSNNIGSGICGKEAPIGWKPPSSVPECLLCSLEAFEWVGYNGRQGDKKIATFLLKNAACLKTARFSPDSTDLGEKYQMLKALASVPTTATSSQLLFD